MTITNTYVKLVNTPMNTLVINPVSRDLSTKLSNMSFVCACMVVLIHCYINPITVVSDAFRHIIGTGVCQISVPFFFVAAGFFLAGKTGEAGWWKRECKKRIWSLLIPFFAWCLLFWVFVLSFPFAANLLHGANLLRNISLSDWQWYVGLDLTRSPSLAPLWFLRSLIFFVFFSPLLLKGMSSRKKAYVFVAFLFCLSALVPWECPNGEWYKFFRKWISLQGLFFFAVGMVLRLYPPTFKTSRTQAIIAIVVGIIGCAIPAYGYVTRGYDNCPMMSIWNYARWAVLPFLLLGIWKFIPSKPWPKILTSNTFPIYLVHWFWLYMFRFLTPVLGNTTIMHILYRFALAFSLSLATAVLSRKLFPRVSAFLYGGR